MALQNHKAELVDLTQDGPSKNEPITITLNDSIQEIHQQPHQHQHHSLQRRDMMIIDNILEPHHNHNHSHHHYQPYPHHHRRHRQQNRFIQVVDVTDSDEEEGSSSGLVEPARKRQHISVSTPYRRACSNCGMMNCLCISPVSLNKAVQANVRSISPVRPIAPIPRPVTPDNQLKCPICIETFKTIKLQGTKCVVTRCGHLFCESCLKKALQQNGRKCPKCRKNVPRSPTAVIEVYDLC